MYPQNSIDEENEFFVENPVLTGHREYLHLRRVPPSPPNTHLRRSKRRPADRRAEGGLHTPLRKSVRDSSARHWALFSWVRGTWTIRTRW